LESTSVEPRTNGVRRAKHQPSVDVPQGAHDGSQLMLKAAALIRGMIIDRELLPGEKLGQVELANRLGVSRSPLREALRTLESEGVVGYEANRGYVVARLDRDDLAQIHLMRSLLEGELLRTVVRPTAEQITALRQINDAWAIAIDKPDVAEITRLNRAFHFAIFDLSPLHEVRREVTRLWQRSDLYSADWWWRTPEAGPRIIAEHKKILAALRKYDIEQLVELCEAHRVGGHERSSQGASGRYDMIH
jgi:DNA-binding GntR family transcriptional regulator